MPHDLEQRIYHGMLQPTPTRSDLVPFGGPYCTFEGDCIAPALCLIPGIYF